MLSPGPPSPISSQPAISINEPGATMEIAQNLDKNGVTPSMLLSQSDVPAVTYQVSHAKYREDGTVISYGDRKDVKVANFQSECESLKAGAAKIIYVTFHSAGTDLDGGKELEFDFLRFVHSIDLFRKSYEDKGLYEFRDGQNKLLDQYWPLSTDSDTTICNAISQKNSLWKSCVSISFQNYSTLRDDVSQLGSLHQQNILPNIAHGLNQDVNNKFPSFYFVGRQLVSGYQLVLSLMCFLLFITIVCLYIFSLKRGGRQELVVDNDFESEHSDIIEVVPVSATTYSNSKCSLSRYLGLMDLMFLCIFSTQLYLSLRQARQHIRRIVAEVFRGGGIVISALWLTASIDSHTSFCSYNVYPVCLPMSFHLTSNVLANSTFMFWVYSVSKTLNERSGNPIVRTKLLWKIVLVCGTVFCTISLCSFLLRAIFEDSLRYVWVPFLVYSVLNNTVLGILFIHFAWRLTRMLTMLIGNLDQEGQEDSMNTLGRFLIFTLVGLSFVLLQNSADIIWIVQIVRHFDGSSGMAIPPNIVFMFHSAASRVLLFLFLWYSWVPFRENSRNASKIHRPIWRRLSSRFKAKHRSGPHVSPFQIDHG
eukprot:7148_1